MSQIKFPHLDNAPILEAILDIRVRFSPNVNIENVLRICEGIKKDFPLRQEQHTANLLLKTIEKRFEPEMTQALINGYLCFSADKKRVAQFRLDGFTFNLQKPYPRWEEFKRDAQSLWKRYSDELKPITIERIGIRYINKIELTRKFVPSKYFKTIPVLGESLEKYDISNFFTQITILNREIDATANITEGIEPFLIEGKENDCNFVLDIDTYSIGDFKEEEIWNKFDELSNFKNEIFFGSITDETLNLIK